MDFLYLAGAVFENYPHATFKIWEIWIWRGHVSHLTCMRNSRFGMLIFGGPGLRATSSLDTLDGDFSFGKLIFGGGMTEKCHDCEI